MNKDGPPFDLRASDSAASGFLGSPLHVCWHEKRPTRKGVGLEFLKYFGRRCLVEAHGHEELGIGSALAQAAFEEFHGLDRIQFAEHTAQAIDQLQFTRIK